MEDWIYISSSGIVVPLEFLNQGGGFAPIVQAAQEIVAGGGMRAGLGELAVMKAKTWLMRGEDHDLEDFEFLLVKMSKTGESFRELQPGDSEEIGDEEALVSAAEDVGAPSRRCY